MTNTIIHVDGSCYNKKYIGWGMLLLRNNEHVEQHGHVVSYHLSGEHETLAISHAIAYCYERGIPPQDISCYCDDELLGYAPTYLHPDNYKALRRDQIIQRMNKVQELCFPLMPSSVFEYYLKEMRITKLKGHKNEVYQERVNFLAKYESTTAGGLLKEFEDYDTWLNKGFINYGPERKASTYYPHFTSPET